MGSRPPQKLIRGRSESLTGPSLRPSGDLACSVDLEEVERGGSQVQFAGRVVQASAREAIDDLLQVADAWFHGCSAPPIEVSPFARAQPVGVCLAWGRARWRPPVGWLFDRD